jgi:pyridoxamine 5'-phosphate oxidase
MTVATVGAGGQPSARTVLLKSHDARGLFIHSHLGGRKGRALPANPRAALLFHWPRVRGGNSTRLTRA